MLTSTFLSRRGRRLLLATAAALLCLSAAVSQAAHAASVTVTSSPASAATPSGFLGISIKYPSLLKFAGTNPSKPNIAFLNLLGDIAPGQRPVLRIGGESADWSWVPIQGQKRPPGDRYSITPSWLRLAAATAKGMNGQLLLGLNLEAANKTDTVGEAKTFIKDIGARNILALELGNEPELYRAFAWYHTASGARVLGRPPNWSLPVYRAQFAQFANALPKGVTIAGPTSGTGVWLQSLAGTLKAEPKIGLVTIHAYPLKHCTRSHVVTIGNVLSSAASYGFVDSIAPYVHTAHADGKPIRIDEMNAITCGGTRGVSDSFATALWMMNTLFGLDRVGVNGINMNVPAGTINAIINPVISHGRIVYQVQPEYYAMIMFEQAAPPGSQILQTHNVVPSTLAAWATRETSGAMHVVLVNKSASGSTSTTIRVPDAVGPASISILHAHGLASTGGVSLNGQSFGASTGTGLLSGTAGTQVVSPVKGTYTVKVPPASVEMLSFTPRPGALLMSALRGRSGLLSSLLPSW
ncbi:MAG TPA: glycosyl hydrolase family 79 C-terminal domain-containing protein [Solirubrobacteraceae bacterium]|nr:glycosyl hydrolase family 79 C-terminal domain-containing protein [Solirubrobacteraceae bacterium]